MQVLDWVLLLFAWGVSMLVAYAYGVNRGHRIGWQLGQDTAPKRIVVVRVDPADYWKGEEVEE